MRNETELAGLQAPRYTSYPTAPNFTSAVGPDVYADWLVKAPANAPVSLYFHVPYCRALCHYCGCHTKATRRQAPVDAYAAHLESEFRLIADRLGAPRQVGHIHWGGGTPSMIGTDALKRITDQIHGRFQWLPTTEHAIELDPRYITSQMARDLAACGITRVSLGIQDFNPRVQDAIGRIQPYDLVIAVVERLRRAGIDQINFDLMYGLPAQTTSDIVATIENTLSLNPTRIALFGYAHVPWFKKNQRLIDEKLLPDASQRLEQIDVANDTLVAAGYDMIGLDHFARPNDALAIAARSGTLRRNFQGYTTDAAETLIGLGASSIGQFEQGYVQNDPTVANWSRAVEDGALATCRGYAISQEDRMRRRIIEKLMCDLKVEPAAVAQSYGIDVDVLTPAFAALHLLADGGFVEIDKGVVRIPDHARHLMRLAASAFDAYLDTSANKHAKAVRGQYCLRQDGHLASLTNRQPASAMIGRDGQCNHQDG